MEEATTKRREWIKNTAIIFLAILLLLTFFSNTIMNYSLPEVATVYVQPNSIATRVRGMATIEGSDPYNVIAAESREITGVAVRVGDVIEKDAVIYNLAAGDSAELQAAEAELELLERNFMLSLFAGNVSAEVMNKVVDGEFYSFDDFKGMLTNAAGGIEAAEKAVEAREKDENKAYGRMYALGIVSEADGMIPAGQVIEKDQLLIEYEEVLDYLLYSVNGILHRYGEVRWTYDDTTVNAAIEEVKNKQRLTELFGDGRISEKEYKASAAAYDQIYGNYTKRKDALDAAREVARREKYAADIALYDAREHLKKLEESQGDTAGKILAEIAFKAQIEEIEAKRAKMEEVREKSLGTTITSPVAGTIISIAHVAGETMKMGDTIAVMQVAGKGFTASFSVSNEQASRVSVGDPAEISGGWWWNDLAVVLTGITPDPNDPGRQRRLTFAVTGTDIQVGQQLNISVGQRSMNYDLTVPNSAVREDSNGKFILIVETRSTPLSNRYYATRADVEVIASDDNNSAISAGIYAYEYVITTATKPVNAGTQVRLTN